MNELTPLGRKRLPDKIIALGRHLIYAEGTKTEPYYIESIKASIALKFSVMPNDITIINANGRKSYNTIKLVNMAIKDVKRRLSEGEIINHVWIFYDKDDFPEENFLRAYKRIKRLNNSHDLNSDGFNYNTYTDIAWHSCYSNEAFELWPCLYFDYDVKNSCRKNYITFLNRQLGYHYSKKFTNLHQRLTQAGGSIENAIKKAKKLSGKDTLDNPSTDVYIFAEYFLAYMD